MLSAASRAGSGSAARRKLRVGSATLLLACACSRSPVPPAGAARETEDSASPSLATADAHLGRGEEAREREDYPRAKAELEKARVLYEREQRWEGYVRARNLLGAVASRQGDHQVALEHLNAALATARERLPPSHLEFARSYYEIGKVYLSTGRNAEALELLGKALVLRRAAGGQQGEEVAEVLLRMGFVHTTLGQEDQALVLIEQAEAIQRATPGGKGRRLADILIGKGNAVWGQGKYDQAIEVFEQAIEILEADGGARGTSLASAYVNLGNAYWSKSDYDEALTFYEKALSLQVATLGETHVDVGTAQLNLAVLHVTKAEHEAAIASAEKALKILIPAVGERHSLVVQAYNILGSAFAAKGDPDRGLGVLEKALAIQLSLSGERDRDSALIYSNLASAYRTKRDFARAAGHYRKALAVDLSIYGERHPDVAEDFVNLGDLYLEKGDEDDALRYYAKAIAANDPQRTTADPDLDPPFDTAFSEEYLLKALKGAARARARRGAKKKHPRDLEQAAVVYEHASRLIDRMRAGYRAEGSKLSMSASATETYDEAIRTELELHRLTGEVLHLEAAFRYAEKSKAGVLRDALNEAEARSFAGIPPALLERERQIRIDLAAADRRLTEALLETGAEEGPLQALREKQFALKREYEALVARFEREHPDYYDLKHRFETVTSQEVGAQALDERTALVEYFLGRDQIFIFVVTRQGLSVTKAPLEASLEDEVSRFRRDISARNFDRSSRSGRRLYRMLLAPVEDRLMGKDLVIVPDGPLSTVPFDALLARDVEPENKDVRELPYLLREHAVSYAYSATLLLQGVRREREPAPDEYVAFAPVFAEGPSRPLGRDAPEYLPASQQEVTDVLGLFRAKQGFFGRFFPGRSRVYIGREATETRLKSADLVRYRYVHLATHGLVNEEHPGLSRLLLMPESGSGEDGVLHLGEVYNLRLNADLVVLSACETGLGRIARGEGIIGLSRGFLYAGAKSLLVSLWPVSDEATSSLIVDFYAELLEGRPKTQALRTAKLRTMVRNPEYAKPYYWSALVLIGHRR